MKDIKRRKLGRTNLLVTELGFGAMNFRKIGNFEGAYELMNYVLDNGVNIIDTARAYNGALPSGEMLESERVVGEVIAKRTDLKEPIVIVTKGHGYTPEEFGPDLQKSLDTLGVTGRHNLKIGNNDIKLVYFLHGISTERWNTIKSSGVLETIKEYKKQGIINFAGFSSHYPFTKEVKEAIDTDVFDVVELPYNVFNRTFGESGDINLLEYINKKDIGIVNMKAFEGNGMVPVYPMLREFINIDYEKMLNFCLSNPYITTVDAGAKYVSEFELDIQTALKPRLSQEEKQALMDEADKVSKYIKNLCRQCMHCLEKFKCPHDVEFVDSLASYSRYLLSTSLDKDPSAHVNDYRAIKMSGKDCLECGECLPWCEYKLNIPKMLKEAHEKMGE